jgi:hypothetical protein
MANLSKNLVIEGDIEVQNDSYFGSSKNYSKIDSGGNQTFNGLAGLYIRRLNQSTIPTSGDGSTQISVGELLTWRDTDDGKIYIVYNDTTSGIKSIELT